MPIIVVAVTNHLLIYLIWMAATVSHMRLYILVIKIPVTHFQLARPFTYKSPITLS